MEGWVKIHRKLLDNDLWTDAEPFDKRSAWIDLIMMVNHKEGIVFNGSTVFAKIPAGSMLTSLRQLSARWHWSREKVRHYLDALERLGMVTRKRHGNVTLLSLIKYGDYQVARDTYRTTNLATDLTTDLTTDLPQTRIYKKDKKERTRASARSSPPTLAEKMEAIRRRAQEEEADNEQQ